MDYKEVYEKYAQLKNILEEKKFAIIKKNIEKLNKLDEETKEIIEKIKGFNLENSENNFTIGEKENLKKLGVEISEIEKNNEILIKHSLDVINNILSGILNIAESDKNSYNSKGCGCVTQESLDISSITEEA